MLISFLGSKLLAQGENVETSISNDSLNLKSKYSKRIQLLMANPNTPSKAAFYSSIIPGLGQAYIGKAWKIRWEIDNKGGARQNGLTFLNGSGGGGEGATLYL